ncbi:Putative aspartic-type endopeptidase opsB [Tolypocladium paradoxum]|uniref:Aspartic-type endopeptidase opsB n=1 Tax=Tolypocladium paradoxum TaxID=94208 RepID=A0A2S4KVI3_9HYPO|nr:Putative aspartic-type endopeptidase opsB [Tolypocladium paradoxum]
MPSPLRGLALLALAASTVSAGTLSVPFVRRADAIPPLTRRDGTVDLQALNNITGGGYYAEFAIGTPPQKLVFQLDTGSSDTWTNFVGTDLCKSREAQANGGLWCLPLFNPNSSSTFKTVDQGGFNITYLDQRHISGDYFNDSVTINGKEVKNQQLGLARKSVRQTGLMGLGFRANVAARKPYATIVDNLVSQGIIDAPVFSLYLVWPHPSSSVPRIIFSAGPELTMHALLQNDLDAKSGTILFGGVDSQKYYGNLTTLPLLSDTQLSDTQPKSNNITSYTVHLEGLDVDGVKLSNLDAAAILDSGSTLTLLPSSQARDISNYFGVKTIKEIPTPLIDCAYRESKGKGVTLKFKFNGKTIKVPVSEMAINAFPDDIQTVLKNSMYASRFSDWKNVCIFGIASAYDYGIKSDKFVLLGDTFLRSAYVAYDMANLQLGIAQANANTDKSNVIEIKKDAKDLPKAAGVAEKDSAAGNLGGPSMAAAAAGTLLMAVAAIVSTL